MTKKHPSGVSHTLDIYDTNLHLCWRRDQVARLRKDMPGTDEIPVDSDGATITVLELLEGGGNAQHLIVWVDRKGLADRPHSQLVNTCAHEASHVAGSILSRLNANTDPSEEHVAYLIGWVTEWIWDNLPGE